VAAEAQFITTVFSSRRKVIVISDCAVASDTGKLFHVLEVATGNARSPKVDRRMDETTQQCWENGNGGDVTLNFDRNVHTQHMKLMAV